MYKNTNGNGIVGQINWAKFQDIVNKISLK
jgi:hypothetical protein